MSHRFVRCPHCKMPHDASERVCPNTGLRMANDTRPPPPQGRVSVPRTSMSELPPPERAPEPLAFDPHRDRVPARDKDDSPKSRAGRDVQDELVGQTVGDRYKIKGVLGQGGMGTVYDAEHLGLSRHVAIKVLSPSQAKKRVAVKRFQQEARAAGAIGHPNICEVYDLGLLDDGSPYLVMEKLVGQTLADRISKEGGLPFDDVVEVVVQVLSGLIAAHDKGIVHRDIKPENIFLARRPGSPPIIKLLDFGVSKMMPEYQNGEEALDLTRTGMVMGTPYYMAPEQARGERNLDGRVDVYACGVVMYEAIVGRRPFLAPNYNALLLAIINNTPKPIREARPTTPPELETIVEHAMTKNRDERYPSALHFLRDLAPNAAEAGVIRLPPPPTVEEKKRAPIVGRIRTFDADNNPSEVERRGMTEPTETAMPILAPIPQHTEPTRLDFRLAEGAADSDELPPAPEEEIDIPVIVEEEGLEEDPTEVYQPGMHPDPVIRAHLAASSSSSGPTALAPPAARAPLPPARPSYPPPAAPPKAAVTARGSKGAKPTAAAPSPTAPPPKAPPPPLRVAPAPPSDHASLSEDWEGETIVKRPEALPPSSAPDAVATNPRPAPPLRELADPARPQRPFNPDETMKLDNSGDFELLDATLFPRRP